MNTLYEAAQQALEALEMSRRFVYADNRPQCDDAIDALRAALAQQDRIEALHAAAEAALKADACIEALRAIVEQQRSMGFDGSPSDELMDEALRALAAVGAA